MVCIAFVFTGHAFQFDILNSAIPSLVTSRTFASILFYALQEYTVSIASSSAPASATPLSSSHSFRTSERLFEGILRLVSIALAVRFVDIAFTCWVIITCTLF